jgi:hypothetical protein
VLATTGPEDTLAECHRQMARLLGSEAEPIQVLRRAEEYRLYWRPDRVRVVLLAESHVYTTPDELDRSIALPTSAPADLPRGFVRLVYCLGYGEPQLLNRPIHSPRNAGTPQFWEIFYSCANSIRTNGDFAPILKETTSSRERVANKLALLRRLRDLGVWLLDASPAALYVPGGRKPSSSTLVKCLQVGWDCHVRQLIATAEPSHIVCVGRGVAGALRDGLSKTDARVTVLAQPNAHLPAAEHHKSHLTYYQLVREANMLV